MDDHKEARYRRKRSIRERQTKRKQRQQTMASLRDEGASQIPRVFIPEAAASVIKRIITILGDLVWHLFNRTSFAKIAAGVIALLVGFIVLSTLFSSKIGPNIQAMGLSLSGKTVPQAENTLLDFWYDELQIDVMFNGELFAQVAPAQLGLSIDASEMAQAARGVGLAGFPFGYQIDPIIAADFNAVQNYMLQIVDSIFIPPYEAGYAWQDGQLIGIDGRPSQELDISLTVERVLQDPASIVQQGRIDLMTISTAPMVSDPSPYLDEAYAFVTGDFTVVGYDPFTNEFEYWQTPREEMARWLAASETGLTIREDAFERFVQAVNVRLEDPEHPRFLNPDTAIETVQEALHNGESEAMLRINYLPQPYQVQAGESGFSIGRKFGIPFRLIEDANPGVVWEQLTIGQEITIPSIDEVVPEDPVPSKRIVVDLDRLWLVAYENGEMIFNWPVSSGRATAPSSPGIYQILDKNEKALGSSFALCSESGCGQWEMDYFMSIYEVAPGLTNGFHGAVLLPNGAHLDGGSQQIHSTFGCVMSDNHQAQSLFEWSEVGTMVEIISNEFPPKSAIARQAVDFITQTIDQNPHDSIFTAHQNQV